MKIKHLLLSVFLTFAAVSATAKDERVLQIPGHEKPLALETLKERMIAKLRGWFVKDVVIVSTRRAYNLTSLISNEKIYYVELEVLKDGEWIVFDDCEMRLKPSTTRSKYLIRFNGSTCWRESFERLIWAGPEGLTPYEMWRLPELLFSRNELGLTR